MAVVPADLAVDLGRLLMLTGTGIPLDVSLDNIAGDMVLAYNKRVTTMIAAG